MQIPPEVLSTRNAVETAIDLSKADRKSTWRGGSDRGEIGYQALGVRGPL